MRQVTVEKTDYNFAFRTANWVARAAQTVGLMPDVLDQDEILAAARARADGLDDFGNPSFL